ncbi:transposase [Oscillospiraceae bacterium CM]|nr:transposase [Oscillospiraceae bacterium CM]
MELQKRKKLRLPEHDYAQNGMYFITMCTKDRQNLFWDVGAIINRPQDIPTLSDYGIIAEKTLFEIPKRYPHVRVDKYVIMPNHIHLILHLDNTDLDGGRIIFAPTTVSKIIQQYKSTVTKEIGMPLWQKSYYEHIIRNEKDYNDIWQYIHTNPEKWHEDKYNKFIMV